MPGNLLRISIRYNTPTCGFTFSRPLTLVLYQGGVIACHCKKKLAPLQAIIRGESDFASGLGSADH
jgi:hypothetical protein